MKNWKTTTSGILTIILPILGMLLKWLNGEPITNSDLAILSAAATSGTGLWFARDAQPVSTLTVNKTL